MRIRIDEKDTTMSGWLKAQKSKTASIRTLIRMASYVYGDRDVTKLGFEELLGRKVVKAEGTEIEEKKEEVQPVKVQEDTSGIQEEENELTGMLSSML